MTSCRHVVCMMSSEPTCTAGKWLHLLDELLDHFDCSHRIITGVPDTLEVTMSSASCRGCCPSVYYDNSKSEGRKPGVIVHGRRRAESNRAGAH